jgi:hypothetical protein
VCLCMFRVFDFMSISTELMAVGNLEFSLLRMKLEDRRTVCDSEKLFFLIRVQLSRGLLGLVIEFNHHFIQLLASCYQEDLV